MARVPKDLWALWNEARPDLQLSVPFNLDAAAKVIFRVGSHSHGTYIPPEVAYGVDDIDLMVICVPPPEFKLGLKNWEHAEYKHGKWDVVFYDWQKWLNMIRKSNPNVVGTLWLESEDILVPNDFKPFEILRQARGQSLSKHMYKAFVGYAQGQLYKMTHHAHQGYMGEKRKRLVEQFGYDVKNAAHLVRLLRMACEAFETGELVVRRPDAADLIEIKWGKWSQERVQDEAARLFARAEEALAKTTLPEHPNDWLLQQMMVKGYQASWERWDEV